MEKLKLSEKVNKLLFYKNKQLEQQILKLEQTIQEYSGKNDIKVPNRIPEINESEKILLLEIEEQNRKIKELQDKFNEKFEANEDSNSHVIFLQKRIEELIMDSKRYFDKFKNIHNSYVNLMTKLTNEKVFEKKQAREAIYNLSRYQKTCQVQITNEQKLYEHRIVELEKIAQDFMVKRKKYEEQIKNLENKLGEKQEQEIKIEEYVNQLLESHKEVKNDIIEILKNIKEGKDVSKEYIMKYIK